MHDFVIVGGGVQGTYLSHALSTGMGISDLVVIDPFEQPLAVWRQHTRACGMRYLRSPSSHNLDLDFHSLRNWAAQHGWDHQQAYVPPYARPQLELFDAHAAAVIHNNNLRRWRRRGTVGRIVLHDDCVDVSFARQRVRARYALLALGRSTELCYPAWSRLTDLHRDVIDHVFSPSFHPQKLSCAQRPVIIGAGASAIQLALATSAQSGRPVTVISQYPIRVRRFDSDPCFIGPRCARDFLAQSDYTVRRAMIETARAPGSIPEDVAQQLAAQRSQKAIRVLEDRVQSAAISGGRLRLKLAGGDSIESDRVVVATGFNPGVPGGRLVAELAARYALPRAEDGFPLPDSFLRWHPRLFVSGTLAELELGPFAPNIIGAIAAAKRLAAFLLEQSDPRPRAWQPLPRLLHQTGSSVAMRA
ncbi:MAG: hypothetical protein EA404_10485 [Spirochaetaceae bacterium]|nr:MAG: hypothetical protein EA404_10485 [Spirochaetaceae bacterium]